MRFLEDGREDDICAPETFHRAVEQRGSGPGIEFKCECLLFFLIGSGFCLPTSVDVTCHSDTIPAEDDFICDCH